MTTRRPKHQQIPVRIPGGERLVDADVYGALAIHPVVMRKGPHEEYWSITHVPTMYRFPNLYGLSERKIRAACKALLATDIDWSNLPIPVTKEIARTIVDTLKPWMEL